MLVLFSGLFCLPVWRSISVLFFAQYVLQFVTQFGFLVFYSRQCPGVFFCRLVRVHLCFGICRFFMLLCLCICYCFCFALATFVGRFFFATFCVLAGFLYNLVLFVHFLAITLSCWVSACLYVLAFRFRHRTRVCLHYHCVAFCVNR